MRRNFEGASRLVACAAWMILFAACWSGPAAAAPPVRLRLNELAPAGSPEAAALRFFQRQVQAGSHGNVAIDLHLGGSLGNPQTSVEDMMFGDLELFSGDLVHYLPLMIDEVSGLTVPYLVTSDPAIRQYLASPLLDEARDKVLVSRHIRFLEMNAVRRPFHILASVRPVKTAGDLRGLRFSSSQPLQNNISRAWSALGASYQPLALADMKAALKNHTIDAALFADLTTLAGSGVMAQAHYLTGVNDAPRIWQISINETAWQRLNADERKILSDAAGQSVAVLEKEAQRQFRRQIDLLTAKGHASYAELDATGTRRGLGALYDALVHEGALNPRVVETANQAMGEDAKDRPP